ncbi:MAG: hypothetical protein ABI887_09695 [Burkholderiales bacterium]
MSPAHPPLFVSLGIAALVAWRIYARVRRMVGRQKLSRVRPWITVVLFPVLLAALLLGSLAHPGSTLALAGGAAVGIGLGVYGLRLTRFEATPEGVFYTPNAHLGVALSLIMVGRIAYRFAHLYLSGTMTTSAPDDFVRSPLTLVIFGTLAGYYVCYAIGLLRWRHRVESRAIGA